jgi:hypothetical protein
MICLYDWLYFSGNGQNWVAAHNVSTLLCACVRATRVLTLGNVSLYLCLSICLSIYLHVYMYGVCMYVHTYMHIRRTMIVPTRNQRRSQLAGPPRCARGRGREGGRGRGRKGEMKREMTVRGAVSVYVLA